MLTSAPEFPRELPEGYFCIEDGITYDPEIHLELELPDKIWSLEEFGYEQSVIDSCASAVAVTSPFRLLSDKGVRDLHHIASGLKTKRSDNPGSSRVPSFLAGGVYRSQFLRDLCACPVILEHMSKIAGTPLAPHSMPSQQVYINYAPDDISKAVDTWHYDGIGFDYVIMVSDPVGMKGGNFEYFRGTKFEIAEMFDLQVHQVRYGISEELAEERVIKTHFPAAGYAIFQQGNMVVHRAARLLEPADRITMIPGLVSNNVSFPDPTSKHDMPRYGEPGIVTELARHSAWLAQGKLQGLIDNLPFTDDFDQVQNELKKAISDVTDTIALAQKPE